MTKDERLKTEEANSSFVLRPSSLIDTHCHLDLSQFDVDCDAVVEHSAAAGVTRIINPAIDLDSCRRVLALADRYPGVYAAVGVHPNDCGDFDEKTVTALRDLAQHPKVVAIGEIGLDYYWERVSHDQQMRAFRAQLSLATELGLPVILHARNPASGATTCTTDLLYQVTQWWPEIRTHLDQGAMLDRVEPAAVGVWHAFSGTLEDAEQAYAAGLMLGLGGPVTFQNARRLHALVPRLRGDRLLLETDAPYLAPHPHRGQRNEPAYVPLIAAGLAQLTGTTAAAVATQTTSAAMRCFTLDKR